MRFGLSFLPDADPATMSAAEYFANALELCRVADDAGMDSAKMTEHLLHPYGGYCPSPLAFFAAVAASTRRLRLMTGGGIAGLRGVHPIRADGVIRPLLEVSRAEIESFLRERNIVPRIDRSNADPRFLRNRVRAILAELDESVTDSLASIAAQAREQWTILEEIVDRYDTAEANSDQTRFTTFPDEPWIRRALLHRHIHRLDPTPGAGIELFGACFQRIPVTHGRQEITGYRFGGAAYLTDMSDIPPESIPLLQDLDILILDALRRQPHPSHSHLERSVAFVEQLKPKRAFFTHISHDLDHATIDAELPPHIRLAYDGLQLNFEIA